jgi:hypothetical protein
LRTIGVQRISPKGIDFVMKKGSGTCDAMAGGRPVAILHLQGRYMPGEQAEQWRGEGYCERIPLDELIELLPHFTITSMVSSKRIEKENPEIMAEVKSGVRSSRQQFCSARPLASTRLTHLFLLLLLIVLICVGGRIASR